MNTPGRMLGVRSTLLSYHYLLLARYQVSYVPSRDTIELIGYIPLGNLGGVLQDWLIEGSVAMPEITGRALGEK